MQNEGRKNQRSMLTIAITFLVFVLGIAMLVNIKNSMDLQAILEKSIREQLVATSLAGRAVLDVDAFEGYNSVADVEVDLEAYVETRAKLRDLCAQTGASYIYALKIIDGVPMFVLDSDPEDEEIFIPYELAQVHRDAFAGRESAGVMNVEDEYGSFNTGAVPIWKSGRIIGIIATDIEDTLLTESTAAARNNAIILVVLLVLAMAALLTAVVLLMRRVNDMQAKLQRLAHYDSVTGLPNRQYLMEYLAQLTGGENPRPFALLFIDLDNFKRVNDNAGHDAGDALLRSIGEYLEKDCQVEGKAFRPAAGVLNIAARIGGDEFVQVAGGIETPEQANKLAQHMLDCFNDGRFSKFTEKYELGLSIGIALFPLHSNNFHVLIKYADIAMYHAKKAGKNTYRVYNEDMEPKDEK